MSSNNFFISNSEEIVARSDLPEKRFLYTPSIAISDDDSLIVSFDMGGDVSSVEGFREFPHSKQKGICFIYKKPNENSDFELTGKLNIVHARLFKLRKRIYILGHNGRPQIAYSDDNGNSWSTLHQIHSSDGWHASSCNVLKTKERIYMCMDRRSDTRFSGWNVAGLSPTLISASLDADLTDEKSWKTSNSFSFSELFEKCSFSYFGIPFMSTGYRWPALTYVKGKVYKSSPMGWLEGNIFQINDEDNFWYDSNGKTFHVLLRCNTAGVGYAAIIRFIEDENRELYAELVRAPSGEPLVFIPLPGGHNKFYIIYDDATSTYWLASTQSYNSMRKLERTPEKAYGLPNNERNRLVLHFSKNCVDWCFAGVIAIGIRPQHARNYPSMIIDKDDLLVVSRAGDDRAKDNQYTNLIMLHRIKKFRSLMY